MNITTNTNTNTITYTKAMEVEQVYDTAAWEHTTHSEGCYALAVDAAHKLGGIELSNSNVYDSSWSFSPTRTFEFADSSPEQFTYGGVCVL